MGCERLIGRTLPLAVTTVMYESTSRWYLGVLVLEHTFLCILIDTYYVVCTLQSICLAFVRYLNVYDCHYEYSVAFAARDTIFALISLATDRNAIQTQTRFLIKTTMFLHTRKLEKIYDIFLRNICELQRRELCFWKLEIAYKSPCFSNNLPKSVKNQIFNIFEPVKF